MKLAIVAAALVFLLFQGCSGGASKVSDPEFASAAIGGRKVIFRKGRLDALFDAQLPPGVEMPRNKSDDFDRLLVRRAVEMEVIAAEAGRRGVESSTKYREALAIATTGVRDRFLLESFMADVKLSPDEIDRAAAAERAVMRGDKAEIEAVWSNRFDPEAVKAAGKSKSLETWAMSSAGSRIVAKKGDLKPVASFPPEIAGELGAMPRGEVVGPLFVGHGQVLVRLLRYENGMGKIDDAQAQKRAEIRLRRTVGQALFENWKKNAVAAVKIEYAAETKAK